MRWAPYGRSASGRRRQRYLCQPPVGKSHTFTPALPREHVHAASEVCETCEEQRGIHRGETAAARRHRWPTPIVAETLDKLSRGLSYGKAGREALAAIGIDEDEPRRASTTTATTSDPPTRISRGTRLSRRAWHIAADWTMAFSAVVFGPIEERLRAEAKAERARLDGLKAAGQRLDRPQILVVDEQPVYGREEGTRRSRRDEGFFLLIVAEVLWPTEELRLRLVRAVPRSNRPAWFLIIDELGYEPDYIVGDASTAIVGWVDSLPATKFIPSLWHLAGAVRTAIDEVRPKDADAGAIYDHLNGLTRGGFALESQAAWHEWWDDLEHLAMAAGLPSERIRRRRALYEDRMLAVLPDLIADPTIPISTGGIESLIEGEVKPMLRRRGAAFANLERTNRLFDLVMARVHGAFTHRRHVIKLLRDDAERHGGHAPVMRQFTDAHPPGGRYSSLRDQTRLMTVARRRGYEPEGEP